MEPIVLIGGGGHAKSVIDSIKSEGKWNIIGILDNSDKIGQYIADIPVIGTDDDLPMLYNQGVRFVFITIGSIGNVHIRRKLFNKVTEIGFLFPNIIDKSAIIAADIELGTGNFFAKRTVINAGSIIGNQTIINTGAIVDHDCFIGDFVHLSPGSVLSGGVKIGRDSHIGTNSTIIQYINIGEQVLIGAGSVVLKDIKDNMKGYGNPCKEAGVWKKYI